MSCCNLTLKLMQALLDVIFWTQEEIGGFSSFFLAEPYGFSTWSLICLLAVCLPVSEPYSIRYLFYNYF